MASRADTGDRPPTRLIAFDLDGTLTRGPTCLEAAVTRYGLADQLVHWRQARTDQERATTRVQAWRELVHRAGPDHTAALATIPLAPGATEGIAELRKAGLRTVIVSLAFAPHVAYFARRLGVDAWIATEPAEDGPFRHVFPTTKPLLLAEHAAALGLTTGQLAAVGDTPDDIPMLRSVGVSVYIGSGPTEGFTPTHWLRAGHLEQIARILLAPGKG